MEIKRLIAARYGLPAGIETRIKSKSLVIMDLEAKRLANKLPASFSNLKKGTKVREESSGKLGRIVKRSGIEYDDGRKFYLVRFKDEHEPRLIEKSLFRII